MTNWPVHFSQYIYVTVAVILSFFFLTLLNEQFNEQKFIYWLFQKTGKERQYSSYTKYYGYVSISNEKNYTLEFWQNKKNFFWAGIFTINNLYYTINLYLFHRFLFMSLTQWSTQCTKSYSSWSQVSDVLDLLFTLSLHSSKTARNFWHSALSAHSSFSLSCGSCTEWKSRLKHNYTN